MGLNQYARRGKAQQTRLPVTSATTVTLTRDQMQAEYLDLLAGAAGGWTLQVPVEPADAGMSWMVNNQVAQTCTIKGYTADGGTTPTTGIALTASKKMIVVWDGSDFVQVTGDK